MKDLVARISETYDSLPKQRYYCEATRTNQGVCYTPGKVRVHAAVSRLRVAQRSRLPLAQDAELAYNSLLSEMRKYSLIVVGDYRTVTFKAF